MTTELLLFWLAVFGNLVLLYYTSKIGFFAAKRLRKGDRAGALRSASAATALAGITVLFPWALVSGEREIGRVALLICILTPFVVSMAKLWPSVKGRIAQAPILVADAAIVGMVVAFAVSGDWAWFWIASAVMAIVWLVARQAASKKLRIPVVRDAEWERLHDPFGRKSGHPSADLNDPCNPLWPGHHHS